MARYSFEGIEYPSVTQILGILDKSAALMGWATKCMKEYFEQNYSADVDPIMLINDARFKYREVSKEALDIGSAVHNHIEKYIKYGQDVKQESIKDEVQNAFLAFLEWEDKNIKKWVKSEMQICHAGIGYAGTLDAVAELKTGEICVIDFKSSKGIYDEYRTQIIAYFEAYKNLGNNADCTGILRLDKETGLPEWENHSKIRGGFEKFYKKEIRFWLSLVDVYYKMKSRRLKNNPIAVKLKEEIK